MTKMYLNHHDDIDAMTDPNSYWDFGTWGNEKIIPMSKEMSAFAHRIVDMFDLQSTRFSIGYSMYEKELSFSYIDADIYVSLDLEEFTLGGIKLFLYYELYVPHSSETFIKYDDFETAEIDFDSISPNIKKPR